MKLEDQIRYHLDRQNLYYELNVKDEGYYKCYSVSVSPEDEKRTHKIMNQITPIDQFYEVHGNL